MIAKELMVDYLVVVRFGYRYKKKNVFKKESKSGRNKVLEVEIGRNYIPRDWR